MSLWVETHNGIVIAADLLLRWAVNKPVVNIMLFAWNNNMHVYVAENNVGSIASIPRMEKFMREDDGKTETDAT
jgi:hypothetical protein